MVKVKMACTLFLASVSQADGCVGVGREGGDDATEGKSQLWNVRGHGQNRTLAGAFHAQRSKMRGVPTGFQELDTVTGGWQGADLVIITTPAATSKMSLALSMALHVAITNQFGVGLLSLDMHKYHIVQRLLAMQTGIDLYRLRSGWIDEEERTLVAATARTLSKAHLWIDDTARLSLQDLRQRAQQLVETHRVALIMVDNLHLIQSSVHGNPIQELGEIHRSLKALAAMLHIPVVVFAPIACPVVSRHARRKERSDQGESSPEEAMDHVLFLYRENLPAPSSESTKMVICRIMITKQHNGLVTEVAITVQSHQTGFRDLERGEGES